MADTKRCPECGAESYPNWFGDWTERCGYCNSRFSTSTAYPDTDSNAGSYTVTFTRSAASIIGNSRSSTKSIRNLSTGNSCENSGPP